MFILVYISFLWRPLLAVDLWYFKEPTNLQEPFAKSGKTSFYGVGKDEKDYSNCLNLFLF